MGDGTGAWSAREQSSSSLPVAAGSNHVDRALICFAVHSASCVLRGRGSTMGWCQERSSAWACIGPVVPTRTKTIFVPFKY